MPLPFQPKPLDADAAAYIARSGATDRTAINAFVRGVKALGLWNSMVCWPLRASQNAGAGDTVYSLGGLGTFNGTRVNGPAWTADGLTFLAASSQGVSATVGNLTLPEQTLFGVSKLAAINTSAVIVARNSTGGSQNGMTLRSNESLYVAGSVQQSGGSTALVNSVLGANDINFHAYAIAANTTSARLKRFPSTEGADASLNFSGDLTNTDPLWIGRRSAASGTADNTMPFAAMLTKDARSSWDSIYSLYKSTLGTGLGLP